MSDETRAPAPAEQSARASETETPETLPSLDANDAAHVKGGRMPVYMELEGVKGDVTSRG